jgi:hypothetical protein
MESGAVYILSNEAFSKNILKVGMTTLPPKERAKQISKHEGVPRDYKVIWSKDVPNVALAEKALHYFLHKYVYNKEFFLLPAELAVLICSEAITRLFAPINEKKLKLEATRLKRLEKEAKRLILKFNLMDKENEIEKFKNEEKNKLSFIPAGVEETNWDSVSESLNYSFGKKAIKLILKEKKKGDPLRKRFICYRTNYWWCEAIHIFFTKKHISVYLKTDREASVLRRINKFPDPTSLKIGKVADGISLKITSEENFRGLKSFLQMGEKHYIPMPPRYK